MRFATECIVFRVQCVALLTDVNTRWPKTESSSPGKVSAYVPFNQLSTTTRCHFRIFIASCCHYCNTSGGSLQAVSFLFWQLGFLVYVFCCFETASLYVALKFAMQTRLKDGFKCRDLQASTSRVLGVPPQPDLFGHSLTVICWEKNTCDFIIGLVSIR